MIRDAVFILLLCLFCSASDVNAQLQSKMKPIGGYTKCEVNVYTIVDSAIDSKSKKKIIVWKFDKNGNPKSFQRFDTDGSFTIISYNDKGKKSEEVSYTSNKRVEVRNTYTYNSHGDLVQEVFNTSGKVKATIRQMAYLYDDSGRVTSSTLLNPNGSVNSKVEFNYDANGNVIEENGSHSIGSRRTFRYDSKNNKLEEIRFQNDSMIRYKLLYRYDENSRITEEVLYNAKEAIDYKYTYSYDVKGNRVKKEIYNIRDGSLAATETMKYDDLGNIIEMKMINPTTLKYMFFEFIYSK